MKNILLIILLVLPIALYSAAPRCLEGTVVSIVDANGKTIKSGKLNSQGSLTLDGVTDAVWDVKLTNNGKSIVLGVNNTKGRIDKATPILFNAKISDYKDGDDLILRKRPGRTKYSDVTLERSEAGIDETNSSERAEANINTSRSNIKQQRNVADSDGDGLDDDCDGATVEVSTKTGRGGSVSIIIKTKK
ncbi:MAG: hypothetical protein CVV25_03560 [Ignavibacteriae bacterium HGW-Ignavibacteriae-4]|jgi:hypothetical protein|nr:MAG: hypothetical protein CVV25_03560 [Ignavibacteriae bacterium HGW-Ignavibacteriae-4]